MHARTLWRLRKPLQAPNRVAFMAHTHARKIPCLTSCDPVVGKTPLFFFMGKALLGFRLCLACALHLVTVGGLRPHTGASQTVAQNLLSTL